MEKSFLNLNWLAFTNDGSLFFVCLFLLSQQKEELSVQEDYEASISPSHQQELVFPQPFSVIWGKCSGFTNSQSLSSFTNTKLPIYT